MFEDLGLNNISKLHYRHPDQDGLRILSSKSSLKITLYLGSKPRYIAIYTEHVRGGEPIRDVDKNSLGSKSDEEDDDYVEQHSVESDSDAYSLDD